MHVRTLFSAQEFPELLRKHKNGLIVAEIGGQVVVYILFYTNDDVGEIDSIAVSSSYRGLKIGDGLLQHGLNQFQELGVRTVSLEVRPENREAVGLYTKHGFTKTESLVDYYYDGGPAD